MLELEFTEGGDHFHSLPCHLISTTLQHRDWYLIYVFDEVNYDLFMLVIPKLGMQYVLRRYLLNGERMTNE